MNTSSPDHKASKETAAAALAFVFLVLTTTWLLLLVLTAESGLMVRASGDKLTELNLLWSSFGWMVDQGDLAQKVFGGFLALVAIGTKLLASAHWFRGHHTLVVLVGSIGVLLSAILLITFWDMSSDAFKTLDDNLLSSGEPLRTAIRIFLAIVVGWYVSFIATQLGLSSEITRRLGRSKSRDEQENVIGGDDDDLANE